MSHQPEKIGKHARHASDASVAPYRRNSASYRGVGAAHAAHKRSSSKSSHKSLSAKKLILIVLAVILFACCAAAAYGAWYIHKINTALMPDESTRDALSEVTKDVQSGEPFYMLVIGSDSREGASTSNNPANQGENERSDVMILLRVDPGNCQVTMVSIPRDTPYTFDDGSVNKLNETYNKGGAALTIKAVEEITGVDIAHYAEVRFSEMQGIVDALGGVTVNVDTALSYKDALTGEWVSIPAGTQTLNGQQAQIFARARHEYGDDQDAHRQQNVRQLAVAMLDSIIAKPIYQIPDTVLNLAEYIGTDLHAGDFLYLARSFSAGKMTLYSCTGPSIGELNHDAGDIWLCYRNPEGWKKLMAVVDAGYDPSDVEYDSTAIKPDQESESAPKEATGLVATGSYSAETHVDSDGGYVEPYGTYYYFNDNEEPVVENPGATVDEPTNAGGASETTDEGAVSEGAGGTNEVPASGETAASGDLGGSGDASS